MGTKSSLGPGHHPIFGGKLFNTPAENILKKKNANKEPCPIPNKGIKCSWCKGCAA